MTSKTQNTIKAAPECERNGAGIRKKQETRDTEFFPIARDDSGALLPPMLERIEAVVSQIGGIRMTVNAKNSAIMFWVILHGLRNARGLSPREKINPVISKDWKNKKNHQQITALLNVENSMVVTQVNTDTIGLKKAVAKLKGKHRVVIDLAFFKGFTHKEISVIEKLPLGTVKSRMRKALTELRVSLN